MVFAVARALLLRIAVVEDEVRRRTSDPTGVRFEFSSIASSSNVAAAMIAEVLSLSSLWLQVTTTRDAVPFMTDPWTNT
jgi:hypothetical protein